MNARNHFIWTARELRKSLLRQRYFIFLATIILACMLSGYLPAFGVSQTFGRRQVAVTFDDLPVASVTELDKESRKDLTEKLLRSLRSHKIPAVGFVNEYELYWFHRQVTGPPDRNGILLLQMWLDAGCELGNHTFAHTDLHQASVSAFKEDVIRGEAVTRKLMQQIGKQLRYFRYPYLHAGKDLETKRGIEQFLSGRGYRIAPVTVDNEDYMFAAAYSKAVERRDKEMMQRVALAYLSYTERAFEYSEKLSLTLFSRQIKHILLLHANALNADYFDQLAQRMKSRGYSFVSLDEALGDNAYGSADTYTGEESLNWLSRWALARGVRTVENVLDDFPDVPEFVLKAAKAM